MLEDTNSLDGAQLSFQEDSCMFPLTIILRQKFKIEPEYDKPTNWPVHPAKTQVSLGIHPVAIVCFCFFFNSKHNEYEAIYRSFKISQNRQSIRREIIHGRLPVTALQEFDNQVQTDHKKMLGEHGLLAAYYK